VRFCYESISVNSSIRVSTRMKITNVPKEDVDSIADIVYPAVPLAHQASGPSGDDIDLVKFTEDRTQLHLNNLTVAARTHFLEEQMRKCYYASAPFQDRKCKRIIQAYLETIGPQTGFRFNKESGQIE